jgi:hypothetical protein
MNKGQWGMIILSGFALILYFSYGRRQSIIHPVMIFIYVLVLIALVLFFYLMIKQRTCAKCRAKLPRFRIPKNQRQALFGGWTCPKCKAELDSSGNVVK